MKNTFNSKTPGENFNHHEEYARRQEMLNRATRRILEHCNSMLCNEEQKLAILGLIHVCLGPNYETETIEKFDEFALTIDGLRYTSFLVSLAEEFDLTIEYCGKGKERNFKERLRNMFNRGSKS